MVRALYFVKYKASLRLSALTLSYISVIKLNYKSTAYSIRTVYREKEDLYTPDTRFINNALYAPLATLYL
jgi:hypothetical protein